LVQTGTVWPTNLFKHLNGTSVLVNLMEELQELETEAAIWAREGTTEERFKQVTSIIAKAEDGCEVLDLPSAKKQITVPSRPMR
jgi:hypothetical protein